MLLLLAEILKKLHLYSSDVVPVLTKYESAALLLLGFGGVSILLAILHKAIRHYVFHDADNVDTAFDAGGKVTTSLTAVTVASQLLWPADLLQSATITVKVGNRIGHLLFSVFVRLVRTEAL